MNGSRYRRSAFSAIVSSLLTAQSWAGLPPDSVDWNLERDEDDIRIYKASVSDSGFEAFKATTVINAPLSNVMAVMVDAESCEEWVHGCSHSEALDGGDFHDRKAYSVNDLPWPAADRDYVLHIRTHTSDESVTGESHDKADSPFIIMELSAVPDEREESGKVRVEHSDTLYQFFQIDDGRTHMTWIQHSEPNGSLPGWLVNSLAVDIPFNSLQNLQDVANSSTYSGYELVFNEQGELTAVRKEQ